MITKKRSSKINVNKIPKASLQVASGLFDNLNNSTTNFNGNSSFATDNGKIKNKKKQNFKNINSLLKKYTLKDKGGYITKEFQDFGFRLATTLDDLKHKSLYIKMAKTMDRSLLERALSFVIDANSARSKARLFMWKIKQLKNEK